MKALRDPQQLLADGLADIRAQFDVPGGFAPEVLAAAEEAAKREPAAHADWTDRAFVTLDPADSTDLDQAFSIEAAGADMLLHYAIADVGWFVRDGDALDAEAWERGTTTYLPDGKASLYPPALSEKAASLLPDGERPAVVLTVRVDPAGEVRLDAATRALIRSRAKLAYAKVSEGDLPQGFASLTTRLAEAEARRGAARVDPGEQQLEPDGNGGFALSFRPYSQAEEQNAALSLAANMAVARAMLEAETGLFRVMAAPDAEAIAELRLTAAAFALDWPAEMPLFQFEKRLDPARPADAAFMLAIRRAGRGASYKPFEPGVLPWHSAIAAPYAHCTAPLRRLADRYVLQAVLALSDGAAVPAPVLAAFDKLPRVMARAGSRDGQIDRAVIDLAEAAILSNREGEQFEAVVTDLRNDRAKIQLCELPVVASVAANGTIPGERLQVRLESANPRQRAISFAIAG
jgi:exoribonuclease R